MRIIQLAGAIAAAATVLAGCSSGGGQQTAITPLTPLTQRPAATTSSTAPTTTPSTTTTATSTSAVPSTAPGAGAPIADVSAWVDAAEPVDPDDFRSATRDGRTATLGANQVAFSLPGGSVECMTDSARIGEGALACLVTLTDPPARPIGQEGQWVPGWVSFDGAEVVVGAMRGDPGPFSVGAGSALADGSALKFGDFRCRSDEQGLFCLNYAQQSAVRLSADGVQPFGCLQRADAPVDASARYSC
ncbi:hypothetical protein [Mycolicibacterium brumae]|uniref:hypothetical protein n=1 Tax=Mycolicibacterium brumae TaxID=85968 RepID=UPI001F30DB4A|nr:hypothetical protein [Mycolicibacterium brumae]UWW08582.1 hypothetical protein L2Z93_001645 [Mycolicibacterium brumae]